MWKIEFQFKRLFSEVQDLAVMESMQSALENVVSAVFDGSNQFGGATSEVQLALSRIFEGFFVISMYLIKNFRLLLFWFC